MLVEKSAEYSGFNPKVAVINEQICDEFAVYREEMAFDTLSSARRIANIFYDGDIVQMFTDSNRMDQTLADIRFDLASYLNIMIDVSRVRQGLSFWQRILTHLYDYVDVFAEGPAGWFYSSERIEELYQYVDDLVLRQLPLPQNLSASPGSDFLEGVKKRTSYQSFRYVFMNNPAITQFSIHSVRDGWDTEREERWLLEEPVQTDEEFLFENFSHLTERQRLLLYMLMQGTTEEEISSAHGFSDDEIQSIKSLVAETFTVNTDPLNEDQQEREADRVTVKECQNSFFTVARGHSLERIVSLLQLLDENALFAFLSRLGYLGEKDYKDFAEERGISQWAYKEDYIRALSQLTAKLQNHEVAESEEVFSLSDLAILATQRQPQRINGSEIRLPYNSHRIAMNDANVLSDSFFLERLTDKERELLSLMLDIRGNDFRYSLDEVAKILNTTRSNVTQVFATITQLFDDPSRERFVTKKGTPVLSNAQKELIVLRKKGLENEQLSNLSPLQREMLDVCTLPDNEGRYESIKDGATAIVGTHPEIFAALAKKIKRNLLNPSQIVEFVSLLDRAVAASQYFTEEEVSAIQKVRQMISDGVPLRNERGPGISYRSIADTLNMNYQHCKYLFGKKIRSR